MKNLSLALVTFLGTASAFTATLYSGPGCTGNTQNVNVFDNTCKTAVNGFQSFKITGGGAGGQYATAYSRNACAGPVNSCQGAASPGFSPNTCYDARSPRDHSGSNAIGSAAGPCK